MFDAVLRRSDLPKRRLGTGLLFSVACHAAVVVALLYASIHVARPLERARDVVFFAAPPPPLSGGGGASRAAQAASRPEPASPAKVMPRAEAKPERLPPRKTERRGDVDSNVDRAPAGGASAEGAQPSGALGGVAAGVPGGMVGGEGMVVPFGEGMTPPTLISGPAPAYTPEALAAGVQGTMVVKCVITVMGTLINCRVIKPLPLMERPVLEALAQRRYAPVVFQGSPINVDYVIPIRLTLEPPGSLAQRR